MSSHPLLITRVTFLVESGTEKGDTKAFFAHQSDAEHFHEDFISLCTKRSLPLGQGYWHSTILLRIETEHHGEAYHIVADARGMQGDTSCASDVHVTQRKVCK